LIIVQITPTCFGYLIVAVYLSTPPHEYSTQQHPSILTGYYNGL